MNNDKMPKIGSRVTVHENSYESTGRIMPNSTDDILILKLDSGYNIGISTSKITSITVEEEPEKHALKTEPGSGKSALAEKSHLSALPTIAILHTGGTIASKVDYETGGVIAKYTPEELLEMFPELEEVAKIKSRLVRNMWSEDMRFGHYNVIAKEIEAEVRSGVQGIIITHGTDTLHYTAAALSFMLQNLPVPVILVGSQRSSDRPSSDAALNLLSAAFFISRHPDFRDVGICMHETTDDDICVILPGTKSRKLHSSARNAFKAVNANPFFKIQFRAKKIEQTGTGFRQAGLAGKTGNATEMEGSHSKFSVSLIDEKLKIAILKIHPNFRAEELLFYKNYDGLIIEGFGIGGHIPINSTDSLTEEHALISDAVAQLIKSGTIVAATTQTVFGIVNMNVYTTGRKMQQLGIIGNYTDMTAETAFVKLAWLLSNYPKDKIPELYCKNLVGEISERVEYTK